MKEVKVIGGGLAGVEAAWQIANRNIKVKLYEMRPKLETGAHKTTDLAEIVCSNSLKTDEIGTAPYLLKEELRRGKSLVLDVAMGTKVPAGSALSVDRRKFAEEITRRIENHQNIELIREEITSLSDDDVTIIASGPLTSPALTSEIIKLCGDEQLYFYDAIAPIVAADSIDSSVAFKAARYDKGGDDYWNCPFDREQYNVFYQELINAKSVPLHHFEETRWFESCLPIEEIARRGVDTLRFGCMKPKGLRDPQTGREPFAAVQLRQEDLMADAFSLVGFQNHLRYGEQERVLRLIPGLQNAEFLQFGQIHRNTYINAPKMLNQHLQVEKQPNLFFAGQITGVEGYVESVATGWLAGLNAVNLLENRNLLNPPSTGAIQSLARYVSNAETKNFQPVNITFALIEELPEDLRRKHRNKRERHGIQVERALNDWNDWLHNINTENQV